MASKSLAHRIRTGRQHRREGDAKGVTRPAVGPAEPAVQRLHWPALDADRASVQSQAAELGRAGLPIAQRRSLAAEIAWLHGNRHLQRVIGALRAVRRETGGPLAAGRRLGASVQRQEEGANQPDPGRVAFERAMRLYSQHKYEAAIASFEQARQTPGIPLEARRDLLYNLAQANLKLYRYATATMYLEEYLVMPGADVEAAQADLRHARERASTIAGGAVLTEEQARATFGRAASLYEQGLYRPAILAFEQVRQWPGLPDDLQGQILYNIGLCNLRLGRYETAIPYFERYLTSPGADVAAGQASLQEARERAGAGAGGEVERPELSPDQARQVFDQGMTLYELGEYRLAATSFRRVLEAPDLAAAVRQSCLFNIGRAYLRLERYADAISYLEQYRATPGADVAEAGALIQQAREAAGMAAPEAGEGAAPPRAEEQTGRPLSDADAAFVRENAARAFSSGDYLAAIRSYERLRSYPGAEQSCLYNIGVCYLRLSRQADAIPYLEACQAMGGIYAEDAESLLLQARGGAGQAGTEAAVPMSPILSGEAAQIMNDAAAAFVQGDYAQAIFYYEQLRRYPEAEQSCLYNIAVCYLRLGRHADAIPYLEEYIAMGGPEAGAESLLLQARAGIGGPGPEGAEAEEPTLSEEEAVRIMNDAAAAYAQGDYIQAIFHYERLRQFPAAEQASVWNIGVLYMDKLQQYADAVPYFEEYIALGGRNAVEARERIELCAAQVGHPAGTTTTPG